MSYYIDAELSYLIKTGELKHNIPNHSNPEDYGLTKEQGVRMRLKYLRGIKKEMESELRDVRSEFLSGRRKYGYLTTNKLQEDIEEIEKNIKYNLKRLKGDSRESFDLNAIKSVPLNTITEILPNGFFVNNPFRNEKSPSNSLSWDRKTNRWKDFSSGDSGSVIDLVMGIENCNFKEACEKLSLSL